jgi:probable rRNA maturation factor
MTHGSTARDSSLERFELSLANQQSGHTVDEQQLLTAARRVLADSKFRSATISLAVVDNATIHALNRRFLDHDWPTDVLSFVLEEREGHLDGELVLSAETAAAAAVAEGNWTAAEEQLLYVIHGVLHLVGYRDHTEADALQMRAAEHFYLRECGVELLSASRVVGNLCASMSNAGRPGGTTAP